MGSWTRRLAAGIVGIVAAGAVATAAFAHTEVEAEPAVAGATNALVTFSAEAESDTSGIVMVRVVLPVGIAPADVTLASAPPGWSLTPTADGYSVGGSALPTGTDAVHAIRVARLPNATRLVFKVLVTYADGRVDRWIEEPTSAHLNPDNPAPILTLQPGTGESAPASATPPASATGPATPPAPGGGATGGGSGGGGGSGVWWLVLGVIVVAALGIGLGMARARRQPSG